MKDAANKATSPAPAPLLKTVDYGKPGAPGPSERESRKERRRKLYKPSIPAPAYGKLKRLTSNFAATLKHDPELLTALSSSPLSFRTDLEHLIRAQYRLKRGRHTDPLIDKACRMVKQGKSVPETLRCQIPDWDKLDAYTRLLALKGLHGAVKRRNQKPKETHPQKP